MFNLSDNEIDALTKYKEASNAINDILFTKIDVNTGFETCKKDLKDAAQYIKILDNLFKKSTFKYHEILYRGMPFDLFKGNIKEVLLPNFISTTKNKDIAETYTEDGKYIYNISLDSDIKLLDIDSILKSQNIYVNTHEKEILIERNIWMILTNRKNANEYDVKLKKKTLHVSETCNVQYFYQPPFSDQNIIDEYNTILELNSNLSINSKDIFNALRITYKIPNNDKNVCIQYIDNKLKEYNKKCSNFKFQQNPNKS